jgi:hypothetical protein
MSGLHTDNAAAAQLRRPMRINTGAACWRLWAGDVPGAAILSAGGAMQSGAGYVKLLTGHAHRSPADLVVDGNALPDALSDKRTSTVPDRALAAMMLCCQRRLVAALDRFTDGTGCDGSNSAAHDVMKRTQP